MKRSVPRLHVITDTSVQTRYSHADLARMAIDGGADGVQIRQKVGRVRDLLRQAESVCEVCARAGVTFIVNDRVDVALAVGADGVHVGQDDMPAALARRLIGNERLLGVSAFTPELGMQALADGADYVGFGPVYGTHSKETGRPDMGVPALREFTRHVVVPTLAIGGVRESHVPELVAVGAHGIAVISAICCADDVPKATAVFVEALRASRATDG